ncbi:MAG: hypothetical protein RLY31_1399 [Bacteroidota bacterium]|jgi:CDP-paratose 2-epimerase
MARHYWKRPLSYIGYGGTGKQVRDILHIEDLLRLVDRQIHEPDLFQGKVYNVGGGLAGSTSLQEMTTLCRQITGNEVPVRPELQGRPADLRIYLSDHAKITRETGWRPEKSTSDILTDIFHWIRANETTLKPILDA